MSFPYNENLNLKQFLSNIKKLEPGDIVTINQEEKTVKETSFSMGSPDDSSIPSNNTVRFTDYSSINDYFDNSYKSDEYKNSTFNVKKCQGSSCSIMGGYRRKSRRSSKRRISRKRKSHRKRRTHRRRKH